MVAGRYSHCRQEGLKGRGRHRPPSPEAAGESPLLLKTHSPTLERMHTRKDTHIQYWPMLICITAPVPAILQVSPKVISLAGSPVLVTWFPNHPYLESGTTPLLVGRWGCIQRYGCQGHRCPDIGGVGKTGSMSERGCGHTCVPGLPC